jgi:hypothetical protein
MRMSRFVALIRAEHRRDPWLWPAAVCILLVLLGVQYAGGAYTAEFSGHPDEAGQFVSALMVYDYLCALPRDVVDWAGQYYLHYPKVAIGRWPPGYHLVCALWWLLAGPSRTTALMLQWLTGSLALILFYRLARPVLPRSVTGLLIAFLIATPVFQHALGQTMADLLCFFWSVVFMQACISLLQGTGRMPYLLLIASFAGAVLTKGTAVCLAPVPFAAFVLQEKRVRAPRAAWIVGLMAIACAAALYLAMGDAMRWSGMTMHMPWRVGEVGKVAGWGALGLATLGLGREAAALVAGSLVASTLGVSFFVRAMSEPRHWMIAMPAIFLLCGLAVVRRPRWMATVMLLAAIATFPYDLYHQTSSAIAVLSARIPKPSRMLVSSSKNDEGPWIAVISAAERRPGSTIMRASKVLSEDDWNGEHYRLLTADEPAVARRLDELAVNFVVLDSPAATRPPPAHHALLRRTVAQSDSWGLCEQGPHTELFCRVKAPAIARQPLRLIVYGRTVAERLPAAGSDGANE